jgi:hypothetical protein
MLGGASIAYFRSRPHKRRETTVARSQQGLPCKVLCLASRATPGRHTWMFPSGAEHDRNDEREMCGMMKLKTAN